MVTNNSLAIKRVVSFDQGLVQTLQEGNHSIDNFEGRIEHHIVIGFNDTNGILYTIPHADRNSYNYYFELYITESPNALCKLLNLHLTESKQEQIDTIGHVKILAEGSNQQDTQTRINDFINTIQGKFNFPIYFLYNTSRLSGRSRNFAPDVNNFDIQNLIETNKFRIITIAASREHIRLSRDQPNNTGKLHIVSVRNTINYTIKNEIPNQSSELRKR